MFVCIQTIFTFKINVWIKMYTYNILSRHFTVCIGTFDYLHVGLGIDTNEVINTERKVNFSI